MKSVKSIFTLGMAALMLVGCGSGKSYTKVEFAKFKEAVEAIKDQPEVEKITVKGEMQGVKFDFSATEATVGDLTEEQLAVLYTIEEGFAIDAYVVSEVPGAEYYTATDGFKLEYKQEGTGEMKLEWDQYGDPTKIYAKATVAGQETKIDLNVTWDYRAKNAE